MENAKDIAIVTYTYNWEQTLKKNGQWVKIDGHKRERKKLKFCTRDFEIVLRCAQTHIGCFHMWFQWLIEIAVSRASSTEHSINYLNKIKLNRSFFAFSERKNDKLLNLAP